jgi:hypothetical protein
MHLRSIFQTWRWAVLAVAICALAGCNRGPTKESLATGEKQILKIATLYQDFRSAHQGRNPKDAQELKDWAKTLKKEELTKRGVDNLDEVFISSRDNQPYVLVKPEAAKPGQGGRPPMLWAYEQTGVDGKRMGVGAMGNAFEMDEEQFKQYTSGGK